MIQFVKLAKWLSDVLAVIGVVFYGLATLVTVADVIGRRLGFPIEGVVDLVQLFVVAGAWLVMPFAFYTATHVSIDFVLNFFSPAIRIPLRIAAAILTMGLVGLMLWQGYMTFETRTMYGDTSQQLGIPVAWYWYPLLVGLFISLLAILAALVVAVKRETAHE